MAERGLRVAGWVLEEPLGEGGFGEVWRVSRPVVGLVRALKLSGPPTSTLCTPGATRSTGWSGQLRCFSHQGSDSLVLTPPSGGLYSHVWMSDTHACASHGDDSATITCWGPDIPAVTAERTTSPSVP